jgi:hypothetical protein
MKGQSRETGTIGYKRHRTKTNKLQKHNTEKKDQQHGSHQKSGVNPGAREKHT